MITAGRAGILWQPFSFHSDCVVITDYSCIINSVQTLFLMFNTQREVLGEVYDSHKSDKTQVIGVVFVID